MTQQYTPVSWQDETTSQQGTLINAERLNQMQTAHHFADGLEETDTVPTADPGVAYHKIVYCTADNTLYRWDGTQWTADIDDPTRELLEEHLADRDNPHQVTKSQVGLGNADNTSDADKPISTATQTALNAKADKSDTYTKTQVDTALATKADKATTYTKTETDTLLGGKADKATTYTKTEIDIALATKADGNTVVHKTGNETITGIKTFENNNIFKGQTIFERNDDQIKLINPTLEVGTMPTGSSKISTLLMCDKSGAYVGYLSHRMQTNGRGQGRLVAYNYDKSANAELTINCDPDGTRYGQVPNRAYTETGPSDIVNISLLDGYLPMVRTTGNQTIAGEKTFTNPVTFSGTNIINLLHNGASGNYAISVKNTTLQKNNAPASNNFPFYIRIKDKNDVLLAEPLGLRIDKDQTSGYLGLSGISMSGPGSTFDMNVYPGYVTAKTRAYDPTHTTDVATIGTLDAYTPMVRTTGNQDISGRKTYLEQIVFKKDQYPLYHTIVDDVSSTGVTAANASGLQFYGASGLYLGRDCLVYNESNKYATHDLRINSIINSGTHARLYIEEKADGTFALSFWNGQAWTRLVQ